LCTALIPRELNALYQKIERGTTRHLPNHHTTEAGGSGCLINNEYSYPGHSSFWNQPRSVAVLACEPGHVCALTSTRHQPRRARSLSIAVRLLPQRHLIIAVVGRIPLAGDHCIGIKPQRRHLLSLTGPLLARLGLLVTPALRPAIWGIADIMARPGSWHHEPRAFAPIENDGHRMGVARLYSQAPQWHRATIGHRAQEDPTSLARGPHVLLADTRGQ
jgi:hypothetical protein